MNALDVPTKVPEELPALDRAIQLLGHLANGHLKKAGRRELHELLGQAPTDAAQATAWKTELKRLRKDEIFHASA